MRVKPDRGRPIRLWALTVRRLPLGMAGRPYRTGRSARDPGRAPGVLLDRGQRKRDLYGTLGVLLAIVFSAYLLAVAIVLGAHVSAEVSRLPDEAALDSALRADSTGVPVRRRVLDGPARPVRPQPHGQRRLTAAQAPAARSSRPNTTIPWTTYTQRAKTASDHHG
jgi:hypothetical protein